MMGLIAYIILVVGIMVSLPFLHNRARFEKEKQLLNGYFYYPMNWKLFVLKSFNNKEDTYEYSDQTRSQ